MILGGTPSLHRHTHQMEVNPLGKLTEDTKLLKPTFDIYECLSPCGQCTGSYSGLGMKVRCLCDCHYKQFPTRRDVSITDSAILTDIKAGGLYTGLSRYTVHTNRQYSKDEKIDEQHSDVIPSSIQKLEKMPT